VTHRASLRFWRCYEGLPQDVRQLADRSYALLKTNPSHPSLHFKKVGQFWSARVGLHYRAVAVDAGDDLEARPTMPSLISTRCCEIRATPHAFCQRMTAAITHIPTMLVTGPWPMRSTCLSSATTRIDVRLRASGFHSFVAWLGWRLHTWNATTGGETGRSVQCVDRSAAPSSTIVVGIC
jgi:hypothetical protein